MPYEFEVMPGERVLHITYSHPFDMANAPAEIAQLIKQHCAWIEDETVYVIHDVRQVSFAFSDLVQWLEAAFQPYNLELAPDHQMRVFAVGSQALLQIAASSLRQAQVGNLRPQVFASLEKALAAIRHETEKSGVL